MERNPELTAFYHSKAWKKISHAYMASKNYICERCGNIGTICHHRKHLNAENFTDTNISLKFDNLECLCLNCHNVEHFGRYKQNERQFIFDDKGNLVMVKDC